MLDPNLGPAYTILGLMHSLNWRGTEAREAYARAYQLSPNDSTVLSEYAFNFLSWAGQHEQAIELGQRAVELDPTIRTRGDLAEVFEYASGYDSALAIWRELLEIDSGAAHVSTPASGDGHPA